MSSSATQGGHNKAIVDYCSPALCSPVNPFLLIGDAAYHQHAGGGPSHGHRQHAQKFGKDRICGSGDILADRQTDILITILRNRSHGRKTILQPLYITCQPVLAVTWT